jgi:carbon-monoxide dehydrogenase medium subunit
MYATSYINPAKTAEAVKVMKQASDGKFLAGGMTLIPTLKARLAAPDMLIDLAQCGLSDINIKADIIEIGAMTNHAEVASSESVADMIPALAILAGGIGDRQVRFRGTIGGSLANNDPAACYPAAALALGATIHTHQRDIEAHKFFVGLFETALKEDEIITSISFPRPQAAAYVKYNNPASRYALVGVFVARFDDNDIRVAVTGAGAGGVFRWEDAERALAQDFTSAALERVVANPDILMSDIHAAADYRAHLIGVMTRRAVTNCV